MKKNITVKVFAWLALVGIVTSIIGTGILFLYETRNLEQNTPTFNDYLRNNPIPIDPSFQAETGSLENDNIQITDLENINE